jgi:alkylated DNA repair dioxygenase AlkB
MHDLFSKPGEFERLPLANADVSLMRDVPMPLPYERLLKRLREETVWRQEQVRLYGKTHDQPRLVAWYGDSGMRYDYSGISLSPLPWTDLLSSIRREVELLTESTFNSVFLNLYRNHRDSMGFHADDERELGPEPCIASLSFGATREFVFKHKRDLKQQTYKVPLAAGDLLLMKGKTQQFWKHGILKQTTPCGPRVNLTFRTIYRD